MDWPVGNIAPQGTLHTHLVLASLLALSLQLAAAPTTCPDASVRLGSPDAATEVHAHLDPTSTATLGTLMELRRLVGQRPASVTVRVHWTHLGVRLDPRADRVREWIAAMSAAGHAMQAVRSVRRDGVDRTFVRLGTARGRAELAASLGVDPSLLEQAAAQHCHAAPMEADRAAVALQMSNRGTPVFRLPVFTVDDLAFEDSGALDRLRPVLARRRSRARAAAQRLPPALPTRRPSSARLRRPEVRAPALGGPGLPHTFVLLARAEDDPALFTMLPLALAYRREHPGMLSVVVVPRGIGPEHGLRHRLCLAEHAGLLPAYLHWLARDPSARASDLATDALLDALDGAVPDPPCDLDPEDDEESLPDGGWLDGVPMSRGELEGLDERLRQHRESYRPLGALLEVPSE